VKSTVSGVFEEFKISEGYIGVFLSLPCWLSPEQRQENFNFGPSLEVTAKLKVVTEMEKNKMAEARKMIICTEFGCYLCHPEEGLILE
jgi:hypothetical protein